ncbi:uncharacterized protein LOC143179058 [Calliopsis andreniformis]|uniref:uncharacterized protein LOC143179058 n=1 Tax=Calliopsis andreniformis TaxID=337506 RepID=UPI003FCD443C
MNSATNYPSCIKIPPINSKQTTINTMCPQKFDVKETFTLNNELISLANRIFGEGKWSHTVTSQTVDFIESFMGKYVCGCVTFVKIQLINGIFHEDMGYCHAEGAMKGAALHCARAGSLTDAFRKTLSCFGNAIEIEIQKLMKKLPNSHAKNVQKEDLQWTTSDEQLGIPEQFDQPTSSETHKDNHKKHTENVCLPGISVQQTKPKSPTEQSSKALPDTKGQLQSNGRHQSESDDGQKQVDQKKGKEIV